VTLHRQQQPVLAPPTPVDPSSTPRRTRGKPLRLHAGSVVARLGSTPENASSAIPPRRARGRGRGQARPDRPARRPRRPSPPPPPPAADDAAEKEDDSWTRSSTENNWFDADSDEDQEESLPDGGPISRIRPPSAFSILPAAAPAPSSGAARKRVKFTNKTKPYSAAPGPTAGPSPPAPAAAASRIGLFRALHEHVKPAFADVRPRTAEERNAITADDIKAVFCSLRRAEITRPSTPANDLAAVAAIKAQRTLTAYNWPTDSVDRELHGIVYGSQVVWLPLCAAARCPRSRSASS
jgi:hypothetical protein